MVPVDVTRAVLAADPLSEHPHVQLMLALYRCGQKVAALDAYSRLREVTTREFGQDPGPEANEMLRRILDDSPEPSAYFSRLDDPRIRYAHHAGPRLTVGAKRNRLFMAASQSLYAVYVLTAGAHIA